MLVVSRVYAGDSLAGGNDGAAVAERLQDLDAGSTTRSYRHDRGSGTAIARREVRHPSGECDPRRAREPSQPAARPAARDDDAEILPRQLLEAGHDFGAEEDNGIVVRWIAERTDEKKLEHAIPYGDRVERQ